MNGSNVVELRGVEVGQLYGPYRVIREGLIPGERIVVEGLQKISNGIEVNPTLVDAETKQDDAVTGS